MVHSLETIHRIERKLQAKHAAGGEYDESHFDDLLDRLEFLESVLSTSRLKSGEELTAYMNSIRERYAEFRAARTPKTRGLYGATCPGCDELLTVALRVSWCDPCRRMWPNSYVQNHLVVTVRDQEAYRNVFKSAHGCNPTIWPATLPEYRQTMKVLGKLVQEEIAQDRLEEGFDDRD